MMSSTYPFDMQFKKYTTTELIRLSFDTREMGFFDRGDMVALIEELASRLKESVNAVSKAYRPREATV